LEQVQAISLGIEDHRRSRIGFEFQHHAESALLVVDLYTRGDAGEVQATGTDPQASGIFAQGPASLPAPVLERHGMTFGVYEISRGDCAAIPGALVGDEEARIEAVTTVELCGQVPVLARGVALWKSGGRIYSGRASARMDGV